MKGIKNMEQNYYDTLCTEMYEILHKDAPQDELEFYLSYAQKGMSILEPLCGSGRFLVPFLERGLAIKGIDSSQAMLEKLLKKAPDAIVVQSKIEEYQTTEHFDYIFISSGSVSLFTDMQLCRMILFKMSKFLKKGGKFVFAVDTVANYCPDQEDHSSEIVVNIDQGCQLVLETKKRYDVATHTLFCPSLYKLYQNDILLQQEQMNFQTHLYELGEMEEMLREIGFIEIKVYSSFKKEIAKTNHSESFLYECSI